MELILAANHPAVQGHFPGNAILPGAALLDEVLGVMEQDSGPSGRCVLVKSAKFPSPARPGDRVAITVHHGLDGSVRLDCAVTDRSVLSAWVQYANESEGANPVRTECSNQLSAQPLETARIDIESLIPHAAPMCLLSRIVNWNSAGVQCVASTHRNAGHPLARGGKLHALAAVEYAAQAMAAHGGLTQAVAKKPNSGMLVALRDVRVHAHYLHELSDDLLVEAALIAGDASGVIYSFSVSAGARSVLNGRATVVLDISG